MPKSRKLVRVIKQELQRISQVIRTLESRISESRGFFKKRSRKEVSDIRRRKEALMQRVLRLHSMPEVPVSVELSLHKELQVLRGRCYQLQVQRY